MALLLIIVATSIMRVTIIVNKTTMEYDEVISYLAATCNQAAFSNADFSLTPTPTATWKQFLVVKRPFCFRQIRADLIQSDVHPPLYFWVLHLWVLVFGVHLWTGPFLNIVISSLATLALFYLARDILHNVYESLLVTISYALNPSIILISKEARQYDLLILFTILTVWLTNEMIQKDTNARRIGILLAVSIAAGNLTHYLFFLTAPVGCLVYAIWQLTYTKRQHRLRQIVLAIMVGYGLALWTNPNFWLNISRQATRNVSPTWAEFVIRSERSLAAFASFYYSLVPLLLLLLIAVFFARKHQKSLQSYLCYIDFQGWPISFFFIWFAGSTIGLYLTFRTPIHTVGSSKYLSMAWPFLAFSPVFLWRAVHRRRSILLYLVLIPLLWIFIFPTQMFLLRLPDPTPQLAKADLILIDNPARGVFFPLVWHIPDQTKLLVAYQEQLLAQPLAWLPHVQGNTLYINMDDSPNTPTQGTALMTLLQHQGYQIDEVPHGIITLTTAYDAYVLQDNKAP